MSRRFARSRGTWLFTVFTVLFIGLPTALLPAGGAAGAAAPAASARPPGAPAPYCGPAIRKDLLTNWTCTFDDEFGGTALDSRKWVPVTTAASGLVPGPGCYVDSPQNIAVYGGALHLTARQESGPFACSGPYGTNWTSYSSGQVATYGRFAQDYGRFAVRAAFPAVTVAGLQSTLWLWPQNPAATGAVGEIDFAEWYSSYPDRNVPYVHYQFDGSTVNPLTGTNVVTNNNCVIGDMSAFHEYVATWSPGSIVIQVDGQTCLVDQYQPTGTDPFAQPFFVALTQALGIGSNSFNPWGTPLPATTTIDYVRVWK